MARQAVEHNLLKYSAKGHLLNAGICRLCYADADSVPAALERYKEIDITFSGSRECNLLESLSQALIDGDVDLFTNEVQQYDSLSKLVSPYQDRYRHNCSHILVIVGYSIP